MNTIVLPHRNARGASLLITLVIIAAIVVLLTIMARLVTVDKRVSRGYSDILRAELAADAAAADAGNLLLELFQEYPDSVTYWDRKLGSTDTPGTVFMYRDLSPRDEHNGGASPKIFARPLISGAETKQFYPTDEYATTLPATAVEKDKSIDINEPRRFNDASESGWIGTLPGSNTLPGKTSLEMRVPWVEIKDESERVVSRYAYWVEDESFKLNVNVTSARLRGNAESELDDQGHARPRASLQALFTQEVSTSIEEARTQMTATGERMMSPLQIGHASTLPAGVTADKFGHQYRYLLTTDSSTLDLSRTGARRLNLNEVVSRSLEGIPEDATGHPDMSDPDAPDKVRRALDQIMAAITSNAPRFGQRYYRLNGMNLLAPTTTVAEAASKNSTNPASAPSALHEQQYVQKIAANIYDYISPAVNPTVIVGGAVDLGQPVYTLQDYGFDMSDRPGDQKPNPLQAMGKKVVPCFTEYMMHARLLSSTKPSERGGVCDYTLKIDHYLEFTNLTGKTIKPAAGDLGPDPYLVLENQPGIVMNDDSPVPGEDIPFGRCFEIKLDDDFMHNGGSGPLEILPGEVVVITTDPEFSPSASPINMLNLAGKKVYIATALYVPGSSTRCDQGMSSPPYPFGEGSATAPMPNVRYYSCTSFDARVGDDNGEIQIGKEMWGSTAMKVLLGNRYGLLEAHPSIGLSRLGSKNMIVFKPTPAAQIPSSYVFTGSFVDGPGVGFFDPRGSLESIDVRPQTFSDGTYATLKLNGITKQQPHPPMNSSLGSVAPLDTGRIWSTDIVTTSTTTNPWAVIENSPVRSISELGNIYDPLRYGKVNPDDMKLMRSGGRTLTIGQPDPVWDGTRTMATPEMQHEVSTSRSWTAWRLQDIFTARKDSGLRGDAKAEVEGLYNINGLLRDEGVVLKALLQGLRFADGTDSDPRLVDALLNTTNTDKLLTESKMASLRNTQLTAGGNALASFMARRLYRSISRRFSPLWEPGELSQLEIFSPSQDRLIHSNAMTSQINDRGREELYRRLADLITVKGNTYSIYVVGQAMNRLGKPVATKARRVIVRLRPAYEPELVDDFDPSDASAVQERFRAPDAYKLEVVSIEDA